MAATPTTQQNNTSHGQATSQPCCPPAAPLLPATSPTSRLLLTAYRPMLVLAIAARCLVSHPALISAPPTVKKNKIRQALFAKIVWIQFLPRQGKNSWQWPMAMGTVMADRDGNCNGWWWSRRQWLTARAMAMAMADGNATEMAAAMGDGDRYGNGQWWRQQQWSMETATEIAMVTESAMATETEMSIAMAMAPVRATMTKGGLPPNVPDMCSAVAGAIPCLHPHGHNGVCIYQCCIMGVTLQRVFAPF